MFLSVLNTASLKASTTVAVQEHIILRLTFFWIFVEAGLGGIMHLLHLPLTGFLVGGFSAITNILIAYFSNDRKQFLKALMMVLLAKFLLSPYSPIGAYVAVFFQGIFAAILFPLFKLNSFTIFFYVILVMLESALQKPLMAYLLFGKELGHGIVIFITNFFHEKVVTVLILKVLLVLYFSLYIVWAFVISHWAIRFITHHKDFEGQYSAALQNRDTPPLNLTKKKKRYTKIIGLLLLLLLLTALSLLSIFAKEQSAPLYLLKTIVLLTLFYVVLPQFLVFLQVRNKNEMPVVIRSAKALFPKMYQNAYKANVISKDYRGFKRLEVFVHLVIWLNIFHVVNET